MAASTKDFKWTLSNRDICRYMLIYQMVKEVKWCDNVQHVLLSIVGANKYGRFSTTWEKLFFSFSFKFFIYSFVLDCFIVIF